MMHPKNGRSLALLQRFHLLDLLVIGFVLFCLFYASIYYDRFVHNHVLNPSKFVIGAWHQERGIKNFDQLVAYGKKMGFYQDKVPVQKPVSFSFFVGVLLCFLFITLALIVLWPNPKNRVAVFFRYGYPGFFALFGLQAVFLLGQVRFEQLPYDSLMVVWESLLLQNDWAIYLPKTFDHWLIEEFFYLSYFNYYLFLPFAGIFLLAKNRKEDFLVFCNTITLAFFVHYIIFILLPIAGPKFGYADGILYPLFPKGIFPFDRGPITTMMNSILYSGEIPACAFPSSHCSVALLCTIFVHRVSKKVGLIMYFWTVSLWIATVYTQQHYLMDTISGVLSGVLLYYFSLTLHQKYYQMISMPVVGAAPSVAKRG